MQELLKGALEGTLKRAFKGTLKGALKETTTGSVETFHGTFTGSLEGLGDRV